MIAVVVIVVIVVIITKPIETGLGERLHGGVNVSVGRGGRYGKGGRRLSTRVASVVDAEGQHSVLCENIRRKLIQKVPFEDSWEIRGRLRQDLGHYQRSKMILERYLIYNSLRDKGVVILLDA